MFVASPANLAKMRQTASPLSNGVTPFNTPAAGVAPIASQAPAASFAEMFGGSPADLVKMRNAREASAGRAAAAGGYAPSPPPTPPPTPPLRRHVRGVPGPPLQDAIPPRRLRLRIPPRPRRPLAFRQHVRGVPRAPPRCARASPSAYDHASGALDRSSDRFVVVWTAVAEVRKTFARRSSPSASNRRWNSPRRSFLRARGSGITWWVVSRSWRLGRVSPGRGDATCRITRTPRGRDDAARERHLRQHEHEGGCDGGGRGDAAKGAGGLPRS